MAVTEEKVLHVLNMEGTEFEDGVVELQIETAEAIVDAKNTNGAAAAIVEVAKIRLAAYLSYLAYCDAPENHLPGEVDQQSGVWKPVAEAAAREQNNMLNKLKALKAVADEAIETMQESSEAVPSIAPAFGRMHIK